MLPRPLLAAALSLLLCLALAAPAAAAPTASHDGSAVVVLSGDVEVPAGEQVDGVFVASGDVRIEGEVDGDVVVASGDVLLAGRVSGDLYTLGGTARLLPSAEVGGDVRYADQRPVVAGRARVGGDVSEQGWPDFGGLFGFLGFFLLWLGVGVSAAILGLLAILAAPRAADALYERSRERVGPTIAIGVAILIGLPLAAVLAAITVLGIPLAIGILLALAPILAVAYVVGAWALGRRLLGPPRHRLLAFLLGLAVLRVLALVPVLGSLVGLAACVVGLGLLGAAIGGARKPTEPDQAL